jgi:RNA polymerase sigma factor (sigma-70 family)
MAQTGDLMESNDSRAAGAFLTTHWTQVLSARGDSPAAQSALGELCAAYYAPVLAFIRRAGHGEDAARDLTQEFFARLLERRGLDTVERGRGRFRSFLLGAVKHFLSDMRDHACAQKRGCGEAALPIEIETDTSPGFQIADTAASNPEREFDRAWAVALLDRALNTLEREHSEEGKAAQFEALKPWLTGDLESLSQATAARELGISEGAVKVAIHRLRKRFRDVVKSEIAQTLDDASEVADELRYLLAVLAG